MQGKIAADAIGSAPTAAAPPATARAGHSRLMYTPTSTPTPSTTPTRAAAKAPAPEAVPGYRLTAAPRGLGDPLAAVRGAGDLFGAATVRSVAQGGTPVGLLFLFAVRPQYLDDPRVVAQLAAPSNPATPGGVPVKRAEWKYDRLYSLAATVRGQTAPPVRPGRRGSACGRWCCAPRRSVAARWPDPRRPEGG